MKPGIAAATVLLGGVLLLAHHCDARAQSPSDEVRLRATVQAVVLLADFSGEVIPADFDPRFALTVRIKSAVPAIANLKAGAVVTFAIHSPSRLFAGEPLKGRTYDFSLCRKIEDGKVKFFGLEVLTLDRTGQLRHGRQRGSCG